MDEQRLIEIEMKFAHQEMTIEALQAAVYEQQKIIEKLELAMKRVGERLKGMEAGGEIGPADEKPPHY